MTRIQSLHPGAKQSPNPCAVFLFPLKCPPHGIVVKLSRYYPLCSVKLNKLIVIV